MSLNRLTLVFSFAVTIVHAKPLDGFWSPDYLTAPAPAPEDGPPSSINANRNPATLKFEVIGIVVAWTCWTVATVLFVFLVGRRLRRRAQNATQALNNVKLKPFGKPTLLKGSNSPPSNSTERFPNMKWGRKNHKANVSEFSISTVNSNGPNEMERQKNMDELSKLYAAVMAHDEEKSVHSKVSALPSPTTPRSPNANYAPLSPRVVPELAHLQRNQTLSNPMAPTPTGPVEETYYAEESHEWQPSRTSTRNTRTTPLSIISGVSERAASIISPRRPRRMSIKDSMISQPMGSAGIRDDDPYADNIPLSPRLYSPGPPPPTPGQKSLYSTYEGADDGDRIHFNPEIAQQQQARKMQAAQDRQYADPSANIMNDGGAPANRQPKPLPFRQVYGDASMRSAPPTKTTFVERTARIHGGPRTGGLKSGIVPSTPYSPYTPFTPMTPITPRRLMTKQDIKKQKKEDKLKVLNEDDMVASENDMWAKA